MRYELYCNDCRRVTPLDRTEYHAGDRDLVHCSNPLCGQEYSIQKLNTYKLPRVFKVRPTRSFVRDATDYPSED